MAHKSDPRRFSFYLQAMHELGGALAASRGKLEQNLPLRETLYRILGTFAVGRGAAFLWDEETRRLVLAAAKGFRGGKNTAIELSRAQRRALAAGARPFHPHMPPGGLEDVADRVRTVLGRVQMQWIIPLGTGNELAGLILLGPRVSGEPMSPLELAVLEEMAAVVALRIEDARARRRLADQFQQLKSMNRQLRQIYLETVRVLARVIDGPPEKSGGPTHSLRVAALAGEIARRLGLSRESRERLYLAGLIHDIGKQIISQEILAKPDRLTPDERRKVETHPVAGYELISHLRFPWGDVAEIIRHHHEKIDGTGYPDRLPGQKISIEAKVLMMAEAFDSMTSDQPWRPRLPFEQIVEQIQQNLGVQFEPRVAQALCEAVETGLEARAESAPDFIPHLELSFNPALIKALLAELRKQIENPSARTGAVVIDVARGDS